MPDYSKTKMYKLVSDNLPPDMVYYGHTVQRLSKRKSQHVADARDDTEGNCTSRIIIEAGAYRIVCLEDWPCANVDEARARERWWIENHPCVNKHIPFRTQEEKIAYKNLWNAENAEKQSNYYKEWSVLNADKVSACSQRWYSKNSDIAKQRSKDSYAKNKEAISADSKKRVVCCTCESDICKGARASHRHSCYKRFCNAFGIDAHFDGLKITE